MFLLWMSLLPSLLKDWIIDVTGRMNVPIEFVLTPAIVSIGAVIGRKIRIHPYQHDDWQVVPNLWGAIVSRPGTLKSPSIAEALKPIESIADLELKRFAEIMSDWEFNKGINEATVTALKEQLIKAIKQNNTSETEVLKDRLNQFRKTIANSTPICKRLKTNDTTVEKLAQILSENPNGIMIVRDELAGWLVSLEKYGREGDREFYLDAWSSKGSYTVDRISRGTLQIPSLCLSIFGGIQPDKLKKLMTNSLSENDEGFLLLELERIL
jgi:putative DNA primase/helicase